nr:hypothetical protein [Tanacetum cinerariifolium]
MYLCSAIEGDDRLVNNVCGVRGGCWCTKLVGHGGLYCRKFTSKHREFAIRMNRLVGEMDEVCQDKIAFVRELESVAGVTVTAKTAVFLKEMMDKEDSREWQLRDLGKEAKERALETELFVQKPILAPISEWICVLFTMEVDVTLSCIL